MARARNLKPAFFENEDLAACEAHARLLFAGLWTLADKEGRLEDRPMRIKAKLFPYESVDIEKLLEQLRHAGFILRGVVGGVRVIHIPQFIKHQNPHKNEAESVLMGTLETTASIEDCGNSGNYQSATEEIGSAPAFTLPSASLPSSSLNPPTLLTEVTPPLAPLTTTASVEVLPAEKSKPAEGETALQSKCRETWSAYANAYLQRYRVEPVRNATVSSQIKQLVQRIGLDAPSVAAFYVGHNKAFYVSSTHTVGALVKDCEALRTQWATDTRVTSSKANEADRLQTQGDGWAQIIAEERAKEQANVS